MLTWLDYFCRKALDEFPETQHGGDPRRAMALSTIRRTMNAKSGKVPFESYIDEAFYSMLLGIIHPFMQGTLTYHGAAPDRALGLILTRETVSLLAGARPMQMKDEIWKDKLGKNQTVYIDIPHGAMTVEVNEDGKDVVELRSIMVSTAFPVEDEYHTLFLVHVTQKGTEADRGRIVGVLTPDGGVKLVGTPDGGPAVDAILQPPFSDPLLHRAVLGQAGYFIRLVLAYYFFGPKEAREQIGITPTERLNNGKPKKGESLFAMTRLLPSDKVGRPSSTIAGSWSLTTRQEVSGHFKLQAYGPQSAERRMIWVDPYERGPDDAPLRPKGVRV